MHTDLAAILDQEGQFERDATPKGKICSIESNFFSSYDVVVIQWITSCHKNHMNTCVITLSRVEVTSLTTSMSTMRFLAEIMLKIVGD